MSGTGLDRTAEGELMIRQAGTDDLTPQQRTLRDLAIRQLKAAQNTLRRIQAVTHDRGDRETVGDALDGTQNAQTLLTLWFGCEPE